MLKLFFLVLAVTWAASPCQAVPVEWGNCYNDLPQMLLDHPNATIAYWLPSSNPHIAASGHVCLILDGYLIDSRYGKLYMDAFGEPDRIFGSVEELDAYITIKI